MKKTNNLSALTILLLAGFLSVMINSCNKTENGASLPIVSTSNVTDITQATVSCGGTILSDGGAAITASGVCWSTNPSPNTDGNKTTENVATGTFSSVITGLTASTTYYVRAYATNSAGTSYGEEFNFTTLSSNVSPTVTDIDGNVYHTVVIGTQVWMMENLNTSKYRDGSNIPNITDANEWKILTTGAYCDYNNTPSFSDTYGKLYNFYAVSDSRNIAPAGWHVATDEDWSILEEYVGGSSTAADKLKEYGTEHWVSMTADITNETGFTALPGGMRDDQGTFMVKGMSGAWWTSTITNDGLYAWFRSMVYNYHWVNRNDDGKNRGYSVRCVAINRVITNFINYKKIRIFNNPWPLNGKTKNKTMKKIITLVLIAALTISSSYAQWNLQSMPTPKGQLQSAKMGDLLYFIGGCDENLTIVSTVEVYNSLSGTWLPATNISSPRCFTASIGGDSALYVAGGVASWNDVVGSTVLDIYQNGVWSSLTLPDSSCFGQTLHVGNKILFAGHLKRYNYGTATLVPSDLVFVYDEVTKTMSVDTLSQARTFVAAATDGIMGIFAGGSQGFNKVSNVVDIYNSTTDSWTTDTLSQARTNFAGIYAGGKFFFAGGAGPGTNLSYNTVDIYDGANWTTAQLSEARAGIAACSGGDKVFFTGGGDVNSQSLQYTSVSSVVDIFDVSQNSWTANNMNFAKVTHTAIGAGNNVYVAGGLSGSSVLDAFEIFDATAGIGESSKSGEVMVFPNPASIEIQLQLPSELIGSEYYINDLAGRLILSGKVMNSNTRIDISDLVNGFYFFNISGSSRQSVKLIKQ